jgi:hypothetical protein
VTLEDEIVAGFQILWQSSWRGRMGYVSKGPVVLPGYPGQAEYATELLQTMVRREKLRALVVQPPDTCEQMSTRLADSGFVLDVFTGAIEASWIIDLSDGFQAVEERMSRETRRYSRQAANRGLSVREGTRQDVETFFELMLSTCRRQGVKPNPPDLSSLLALWDAAEPSRCIRLFFAEYKARPLSGLLCIIFGKTFTLWKKGWTTTEGRLHPNHLVTYEALRWASQVGFRFFDCAAFDKQMAIALMRGDRLSPEQEHSRHIFHMRFGGSPRLLPEPRIYFPNSLIRLAYRVIFHKKIRRAEKKLGRAFVSNCDDLKPSGA